MKPNNEKGGNKSMYKKSKRFLAGFLALLLTVTMLPTDMLSVVYAEEGESVNADAGNNADVKDDADEVLEDVKADDADKVLEDAKSDDADEVLDDAKADDADEALEEDDDLKEADTPTTDIEESKESESEKEIIEPVREREEITAEITEKETDNKAGTYTFSAEEELGASGLNLDKSASVPKDATLKNTYFKLGGEGSTRGNSSTYSLQIAIAEASWLEFEVSGKATVVISATSTGGSNVSPIGIRKGESELVAEDSNATSVTGTSATTLTYSNLSSGTYKIVSPADELNVRGVRLISVTVTEEDDNGPEVNLGNATVSLSVNNEEMDKDTDDTWTAEYTGKEIKPNVSVTAEVDGEETDITNYCTISFSREDNETSDFTKVGTINIKITPKDGMNVTGETTAVFKITEATLETEDYSRIVDASIYDEENQDLTGEVNLADYITSLSDKDTFTYTLNTESSDYVKGNVIAVNDDDELVASISDNTLSYTLAESKPDSVEATVLVVDVTSDNYKPAQITVTIDIQAKASITVTIADAEHTYNKSKYGFADKAVITVDDENFTEDQITELKEDLNYTFSKQDEALADEPVDAGSYTVTATLSESSEYTLSDEVTATLTIKPKMVKIQAKAQTWDKALNPSNPPSAKDEAAAGDYDFIAVDEEENFGLESGDSMVKQPALKYYKTYENEDSAEMTDEDWAVLADGDTVDIMLSGADAGANYDIAYEKGTLTTSLRTPDTSMTVIPESGASLVSKLTSGATYSQNTLVADNYFLITAESGSTVTTDTNNNRVRLKVGGTGNQFKRSIGFKTSKAAKVSIEVQSASSGNARPLIVAKLNDDNTVTQCGGKTDINATETVVVSLPDAGVYYIYSGSSGLNFFEIAVSYESASDTVSVTPTISDDALTTLDGAKIYFTAGSEEIEVANGTAMNLTEGTTYTLVIKKDNAVVNNLTAKINGETTYTPSADANVTITIEEANDPTPEETVTITPTISAEDQAKLGNAQVVFVESGETPITVTSGEALTLKKGVEYVLNVVNVPNGITFTAKINGETTYTPSADANVTITIDKKEASNVATPVANPAGGTELPTAGGSVTLTCATADAKIYYTTDGSDPADTENTARKEYTEAIEIKAETTLRAVAVVGDDVSDELEAHYTILPEGGIPMPTADKASGKVDFGTTVTLTCSDSDAKIYYAINGTEPTQNSIEYTGPITITESITIKAVAIKDNKSSAVATFEYEVEEAEEPGPVEKTIQLRDCVITVPSILEGSKTGVVTYVTYKDPDTKKTVKFTEGIDYTVAAKDGATNTLVLTGAERDPYDGRSVDGYTISKENPVEKTYSVITKLNAKNKSQYIDVSKAKITLNKTETKGLYYTGYAQEPSLDFSKDSEYKTLYDAGKLNIAYRNNINAGTATVIISVIPDEIAADTPSTAAIEAYDAEGTTEPSSEVPPAADTSKVYYGAKTLTFSIKKAALNKNNAKATAEARVVLPTDLNYSGDAITADSIQVVTKPAEGTGLQLKRDRDYTVTYKNNQKAGKATITLKGIGNNLSGSYAATYTIGALDMSGWSFDMTEGMLENAFVYSPKGARLTWLQISKGEGENKESVVLEEGIDYTAKYTYADKKDKKAGTKATVVIKGKNGCKGTVTVPELTIAKADFADCIKLTAKKGFSDGYYFYVDKDSKKDVLTDLKKTVIVTDNAGVKLSLDKDYVIEKVTPEANAPEDAKDKYVVKASTTAKENYKEKTEQDPGVNEEVNIPYVVAANLAKDKSFLMSKTLEKSDPLGYDGRNPVEITQDALDKYINGLDITKEILDKDRKYLLDTDEAWGNIVIVEGSYKNNAKKGTAQVTIAGTGWSDENHTAYYGTKVLKFKIVDK